MCGYNKLFYRILKAPIEVANKENTQFLWKQTNANKRDKTYNKYEKRTIQDKQERQQH